MAQGVEWKRNEGYGGGGWIYRNAGFHVRGWSWDGARYDHFSPPDPRLDLGPVLPGSSAGDSSHLAVGSDDGHSRYHPYYC